MDMSGELLGTTFTRTYGSFLSRSNMMFMHPFARRFTDSGSQRCSVQLFTGSLHTPAAWQVRDMKPVW